MSSSNYFFVAMPLTLEGYLGIHILKESSNAYYKHFTKKLNGVKRIQYSAVNQIFNIIHTICKFFRTVSWVLLLLLIVKGS